VLMDNQGAVLRPGENSAGAAPEALLGEVNNPDAFDEAMYYEGLIGEMLNRNILKRRPGSLGVLEMAGESFSQVVKTLNGGRECRADVRDIGMIIAENGLQVFKVEGLLDVVYQLFDLRERHGHIIVHNLIGVTCPTT
jgi:hypothetical protein